MILTALCVFHFRNTYLPIWWKILSNTFERVFFFYYAPGATFFASTCLLKWISIWMHLLDFRFKYLSRVCTWSGHKTGLDAFEQFSRTAFRCSFKKNRPNAFENFHQPRLDAVYNKNRVWMRQFCVWCLHGIRWPNYNFENT